MSITELFSLPMRYKPWRPRHFRLIVRDMVSLSCQQEHSHEAHLRSAIGWLCRAQDVRDGYGDAGGVSAGWSFADGWLPSYPETTGYIIETFLAAADVLDMPELVQRARRMIDWELSIQQQDGAFPGHFGEPGSHPVIFNTGQIMHGMIAGYYQLGRDDCLEAAIRAGRWLVSLLEPEGYWRRFEHNDVPHVYNTRATWALASTAVIGNDAVLKKAAARNLDWALSQQTESGWFATNAFTPDRSPFTHTIAYAIRGLLESGIVLDEERYIEAAIKAARGMADVQREDGWLAGTYDDGWKPTASYSCLTGVAQMSLNWLRLAQDCAQGDLRDAAQRGIAYVKRNHYLDDRDEIAQGAVAGSAPIWGGYSRFEFPNWAAKFFADALMMDLTEEAVPPVPTRNRSSRREENNA